MTKKLEANGMWESSRMILPEHREAYIAHQQRIQQHEKPTPDDQAWEEWGRLLHESYIGGRLITLTVYDPIEDHVVMGQVLRMDPHQQRLLFLHGHLKTWVPYEDIIGLR